MTIKEFALQVLLRSERPLSPREIWQEGCALGFDKELKSEGKTPWESISACIYISLKAGNSEFIQVSKRPALFSAAVATLPSATAVSDEQLPATELEDNLPEGNDVKRNFHERDLHCLLVKYVNSCQDFSCHCKTIFHERSSRGTSKRNEWLHPDLVGVKYLFDNYKKEVVSLFKHLGDESVRLFSFEMKKCLNYNNLRESYFQAVSNSSWANEGYLVALDIDKSEGFMSELWRLNKSFGIGIIQLNAENPAQSERLIPAVIRENIDWDTVNRMCENPDFAEFLGDINSSCSISSMHGNYDDVLSEEEMRQYIAAKGIL